MIILFLLCFALGFWKIKRRVATSDPLCPTTTTSINGIFVLLVMISHFFQYAGNQLTSTPHALYAGARSIMGQGVVATFLFFSGYGIMEQITKKNRAYARSIFQNRFLKVLFHFDIAILLFLGMEYLLLAAKKKDSSTAILFWSSLQRLVL